MKKYLTVYCGSNTGKNPIYIQAAKDLAEVMVANKYHLKYGAGNVGLMGVIADRSLALGGEVVGIIPQHLMDLEVGHTGVTELVVTKNMHERKHLLASDTAGYIAMPGGIGTLEEIIEVMTWSQLDLHPLPVCFYNINGFYDKLLDFMHHMVSENFLKPDQVDKLIISNNAGDLIEQINNYEHLYTPKWIAR